MLQQVSGDDPTVVRPADRRGGVRIGVVWVLAALLLAGEAWVDHLPRFFLGDSVAYLSTDAIHLPPDPSWAFGLLSRWLLVTSGHHLAFLIAQLGAFLAVLMGCLTFFDPARGRSRVAYAVFVALACLDPLLGLYARFYMTDLLACLLFVGFLACVCRALLGSWGQLFWWMPAMAVCITGAVFARVAYLLIGLLTIGIAGLWAVRCRPGLVSRLVVVAALPLVAAGALLGANRAVFAERFPGELFLNKSAGIFLLGTFAPAVTADDFRAAGVPVLDSEVAALDLPSYDKRGAQIWGSDERSAQGLIRMHLGLTATYPAALDSVSKSVVWHAVVRNPLAVAAVYGNGLLFYFQPHQWRRFLKHEVGLTRILPANAVQDLNRIAAPAVAADITQVRSPMLDGFLRGATLYPVLLIIGAAAACWQLLRRRSSIEGVLASAALLAVLASAPLYSVYVIPRYVIGAVLLTYLVGAELFSRRAGETRARVRALGAVVSEGRLAGGGR